MNTAALIATLHCLCASPLRLGTQLTAAMVLRLGSLALALFTAIGQLVHQQRDPRLVLAYCDLVEKFAQQIHREQLATALDAVLRGAHALSLETFDQLRAGTCVLEGEPELAAGRCCYKSAGDLLAAWLGLNYFEAQRRIDDAHLLIGRRTAQGEPCAPRLPQLARLYAAGGADRHGRHRVRSQPAGGRDDGIGALDAGQRSPHDVAHRGRHRPPYWPVKRMPDEKAGSVVHPAHRSLILSHPAIWRKQARNIPPEHHSRRLPVIACLPPGSGCARGQPSEWIPTRTLRPRHCAEDTAPMVEMTSTDPGTMPSIACDETPASRYGLVEVSDRAICTVTGTVVDHRCVRRRYVE
jgi:hypothetical protein